MNCPRQIAKRIIADSSFSRSQGQWRPCRDDRYWRKAVIRQKADVSQMPIAGIGFSNAGSASAHRMGRQVEKRTLPTGDAVLDRRSRQEIVRET
jgi:hypothetical protein